QGAMALRGGELVIGAREMVHADIDVAGSEEFFQAELKNSELLDSGGQARLECALLLFQPGDVGVAEEGDAVGRERERLVHGGGEARGGLVGQAVDEVYIDAVE